MQSGILSKNIWKITMLLVFAAFVAAPYITLQGAVKGVRLWFNTVLPSMLPCIIISNLIINAYGRSFRYPWLYIIITGLFCGYPMGAKSCADLYGHDYKNACMTQFLLAVCNYSSPAFITGYCIAQTLIMKEHTLLILAILYIPVILFLAVELIAHRDFYFRRPSSIDILHNTTAKSTAVLSDAAHMPDVQCVDDAIMNGFEIITKLGGYIILFTIFSEFTASLPVGRGLHLAICAVSEITTGTAAVCAADISAQMKVVCVCTAIAFGGLSCATQTCSVISHTFYSIKKYTYHKLSMAAITAIVAVICVYVFM